MTQNFSYGVNLSENQFKKRTRAITNNSPITIGLAHHELTGRHELMSTKNQINKIKKAINQGVGSDIKISKTQIRNVVKKEEVYSHV